MNQIRYPTIYYIENLHFILVSVLRNQFLRVIYVLSYVFFVCDVEVVGTENLMESIKGWREDIKSAGKFGRGFKGMLENIEALFQ